MSNIQRRRDGLSAGGAAFLVLAILLFLAVGLSLYSELTRVDEEPTPSTETATTTETTSAETTVETTRPRYEASDLKLTDIDGTSFDLRDYEGRVIVLVVMSVRECGACELQVMHLINLTKAFSPSEVFVITIERNAEVTVEEMRQYMQDHGAAWIVVHDPSGLSAEAYPAPGLPSLYVIDKSFKVAEERIGLMSIGELRLLVELLLEE